MEQPQLGYAVAGALAVVLALVGRRMCELLLSEQLVALLATIQAYASRDVTATRDNGAGNDVSARSDVR